MLSKGRIVAGVLMILWSGYSNASSIATMFYPVSPEWIGDWELRYQTDPLVHYNIPLFIHVNEAGIVEWRDDRFWLDSSYIYDRQIRFEWGLNAAYAGLRVSEWHYSFTGSLQRNHQDELHMIGTLSGTEYNQSCHMSAHKTECPRIMVSGKWSAKKIKPEEAFDKAAPK